MNISELLDDLITGATLFGTGGGGSPLKARNILAGIRAAGALPELLPLACFPPQALFISAFGIGGIQSAARVEVSLLGAYKTIVSQLDELPAAIVPVEIGALSIAKAFELASLTGLPVLDADIVGGRSSPEVFLETITLFDLPRTPFVTCNAEGDRALLLRSSSPQREEVFLRDFARMSGGDASVVGYVLSAAEAAKALVQGTVSKAIQAGKLLKAGRRRDFEQCFSSQVLFKGKVTDLTDSSDRAFLERWIGIAAEEMQARIYAKNENLLLFINDEPVLTCPDLIALLNADGLPLCNADLETGMQVEVLALPACDLWRSEQGKKLFSPRVFDFNFDAILLPCD